MVSAASVPPIRKRSMREGWTSGTIAASLILPMRRPLRSKTGIGTSSVKYRRLSAIEDAPAPRQFERDSERGSTLVLTCALHGFTDATFTMAHRVGEPQQKSAA